MHLRNQNDQDMRRNSNDVTMPRYSCEDHCYINKQSQSTIINTGRLRGCRFRLLETTPCFLGNLSVVDMADGREVPLTLKSYYCDL